MQKLRPKTLKHAYLQIIIPLISFLIFVVFFWLQIKESKNIYDVLMNKLQQTIETQSLVLSLPLWNVNEKRITSICQAIVNDPDISGIVVFDDQHNIFTSVGIFDHWDNEQIIAWTQQYGQIQHGFFWDNVSHFFAALGGGDKETEYYFLSNEMFFDTDSGQEPVGRLIVAASSKHMQKNYQASVLEELGICLFILLSMSVSALLAHRYTVGFPLARLRQAITSAQGGESNDLKVLRESLNEVDFITRTFKELWRSHKKSESELRQSKDFLQTIIDSFPDSVLVINRDYRVVMANSRARATLSSESVKEALTCHQISHHSPVPCHGEDHPCPLVEVLATKAPFVVEHKHFDCQQNVIDVEVSAAPIFDEDGEVVMVIETCRDISDRKQAEEVRMDLERRAQNAQRMESLGVLAGGIAHDFNNVLSAIFGYLHLSIACCSDDKLKNYLQEADNAAKRATSLVKQILAFSRDAEVVKENILVVPIVKETLKFLDKALPAPITTKCVIHDENLVVHASPIHINQIIMNLSTNAFHAMEEKGGGSLLVDIDSCSLTDAEAQLVGVEPADYVRIKVIDSGIGIKKELISKIFNPFFTTKTVGKGTGLGLSIVHSSLSEMHGGITVDSEEGDGTTVTLYLPKVDTPDEREKSEHANILKGSQSILLVDDEEPLLESLSLNLRRHGYSVKTISDPSEALTLFEADPNKFDLLITDETMPVMSGVELSKAVLAICPDFPIILCSGFLEKSRIFEAKELGVKQVLDKPVEFAALTRSIRELCA